MGQRIRTSQVLRVLADAGRDPSAHDGDDWLPGFRAVANGPRVVYVFHDGPGEAEGLAAYTSDLRAADYHVVEVHPLGMQNRLTVIRP